MNIQNLKNKILNGQPISDLEAISLADIKPEQYEELFSAAAEITRHFCSDQFDSCSIINARSGKCSENCKWCAQSAHFNTGATTYPLVSRETCMQMAEMNRQHGIRRFSLVTSGKAMHGAELDRACEYYREMQQQGGMHLCASMGLLNEEELQKLIDAGVSRYHCNLETAPSYFPELCTTHSQEDKIKTIRTAQKLGMEICSGGIIGMGETRLQRIELALKLRELNVDSIPVNFLQPIPGTPLENVEYISEKEILVTTAIYRFIHPRIVIRFAGGRARVSRENQLRAIHIGMNGGIMGDLLTTIGAQVSEDKKLIAEAGLKF